MSDAPETTCPYCDEDALTVAHFQGVTEEHARMQARIGALAAENLRLRRFAYQAMQQLSLRPATQEYADIAHDILFRALAKKETPNELPR